MIASIDRSTFLSTQARFICSISFLHCLPLFLTLPISVNKSQGLVKHFIFIHLFSQFQELCRFRFRLQVTQTYISVTLCLWLHQLRLRLVNLIAIILFLSFRVKAISSNPYQVYTSCSSPVLAIKTPVVLSHSFKRNQVSLPFSLLQRRSSPVVSIPLFN